MGKRIKTRCEECRNNTNQDVIFATRVLRDEEYITRQTSVKSYEEYMVVQCLGCNTISFLLRLSGKNFIDEELGRNYLDINFPEREYDNEIPLLNFHDQRKLPRQLIKLYEEVEIAFENDANMLAGIGLRMLIEAACLEQHIQGSNLKIKIERLHDAGLISKNEIAILDKLREIGNMSAHEIKSFSIYKLKHALEVINHILKSIYILPKISKKIKL